MLSALQSLHASDSKASGTAVAELREMLKEASSPAERAVVQKELVAAERGELGGQRKRLRSAVQCSSRPEELWTFAPPNRAALGMLRLRLAGADRQRKKLLKTVPIVGVTCCSSMLSALDNQQVRRGGGRLI